MEGENKEISTVEKTQNKWQKFLLFIWDLAKIAILAFIIVAPIRYFLFQPFIVSGTSMSPTFATGDYLIINEITYRFSQPQRGDIVVFDASFLDRFNGEKFIKRIIGLPGETVSIADGKVQIIKDDKITVLNEKYLPEGLKTYGYNGSDLSLLPEEVKLGDNQYFVLGDNRQQSYDSRYWGVVHKKDIIGKAAIRVLPITSLSEITNPVY
jgi:signal peptidase I